MVVTTASPRPGSEPLVRHEVSTVRLVIADHPLFCDGLRALAERERGFEVVGTARTDEEAVSLVAQLEPDILLLDLDIPGLNGLDVLRRVAANPSPVRTILLAARVEKAEVVKVLQLGARAVVLKDLTSDLLFRCIRDVMAGQYWIDRGSVADLIEALRAMSEVGDTPRRERKFGLTPRELETIKRVLDGCTNREIARGFTVSEDTIKHHLTNIYDKVGASNRLELALFATHHRLVDS